MISYLESTARERIEALFDAESFVEWLPPERCLTSPHLAELGLPQALDDGVVIGHARLERQPVLVAAQEGGFMGGSVGEVHGAKLTGLLRRALVLRPAAVLVLAESGGVRLHEANAGLIAVSEVMRALLDVRNAGIPVLALIGGRNGCFGGMGIIAACANHVVMSDLGRLALSGPEVIEASHGVDEYDARDRALVWRTSGGKHRWLSGDCDDLVEDSIAAFRAAAVAAMARPVRGAVTLALLEAQHALLDTRARQMPEAEWEQGGHDEATRLWQRLGIARAEHVGALDVDAVKSLRAQEGTS